jgi:ribosomal protein S17E
MFCNQCQENRGIVFEVVHENHKKITNGVQLYYTR